MMNRRDILESTKAMHGRFFEGDRCCELCITFKPRKGGGNLPGSSPLRQGKWACADCLAKRNTNQGE